MVAEHPNSIRKAKPLHDPPRMPIDLETIPCNTWTLIPFLTILTQSLQPFASFSLVGHQVGLPELRPPSQAETPDPFGIGNIDLASHPL